MFIANCSHGVERTFPSNCKSGGHQTGLLHLCESQLEAVVNQVVELTGDCYRQQRQPGRAHQRVEETRQTGRDFIYAIHLIEVG
jgi:hypothetical protein